MNMLYDSDSFVVVHMEPHAGDIDVQQKEGGELVARPKEERPTIGGHPALERHGFEIVDKRSGKEVYLDGSWAELFQRQITAWRDHTPTQEEVEDTLERYAELAQNPVVMH
ncbi:DUF3567 domain-containing protein [Pseudorhodoferax sp. Leaf267]|uniref:BTH_I0359 family protein n=1 Tax=Pseudorhodoferax sp. Leaf267 TaxID=1736316 RepID=UPI0006F7550C|nr:DUF3567 domain-containing protein [Pseudorhodoferax sp. Leaf267]KQP12559.1 hypothetical protein ASF43_20120 [Pseudorhodoferax sp. Leaf267]